MGRMADARKRARRPDSKRGRRPKREAPADASPEKPGASAEATAPETTPPAGRIELPSSGLASEVLARPEAAAIEPGTAASDAAEPAPEASPAAAGQGGQSLSFFAAPAPEQRQAAEATEHLATFVLDR